MPQVCFILTDPKVHKLPGGYKKAQQAAAAAAAAAAEAEEQAAAKRDKAEKLAHAPAGGGAAAAGEAEVAAMLGAEAEAMARTVGVLPAGAMQEPPPPEPEPANKYGFEAAAAAQSDDGLSEPSIGPPARLTLLPPSLPTVARIISLTPPALARVILRVYNISSRPLTPASYHLVDTIMISL